MKEIYTRQRADYWEQLTEQERKAFSVYMINRFLSMSIDYLPIVNELQTHYENIGGREAYLYYCSVIPKKSQFYKYIKKSSEKKEDTDTIQLVAKHFQVGTSEAAEYVELYNSTSDGKKALKELIAMYG